MYKKSWMKKLNGKHPGKQRRKQKNNNLLDIGSEDLICTELHQDLIESICRNGDELSEHKSKLLMEDSAYVTELVTQLYTQFVGYLIRYIVR